MSLKFSPLKERMRELTEFTGQEADILGVVVTPVQPVGSDYDLAAEHNISLIGREEVEELFKILHAGNVFNFDFIKYLRGLQFRSWQ